MISDRLNSMLPLWMAFHVNYLLKPMWIGFDESFTRNMYYMWIRGWSGAYKPEGLVFNPRASCVLVSVIHAISAQWYYTPVL